MVRWLLAITDPQLLLLLGLVGNVYIVVVN